MDKPKTGALVVGAGVGGIAAAIRLAAKGYEVQVFESADKPGGKLSVIEQGGFRFDAGPSLFTMPGLVGELFELAGLDPANHFKFRRLGIICRYFYQDGTVIDAHADAHRFAEEIGQKTADSPQAVLRFLKKSKKIYDITNPVFLERSLHKLSTYLNLTTARSFLSLGSIDAFKSMDEANRRCFNDSRTIRLFNRYATYNGSNPYKAPATLNVIPHLEYHFGAFFPEGGMYAITEALMFIAKHLGVTFHFNTPVDEILIKNGQAAGIRAREQEYVSDVVVSNVDVWYTYRKLLPGLKAPERILKAERSSSALIFYWGINALFPQLDLHNIFFSEDYQKEFRHIWDLNSISTDPTIYINISSKFAANDAPPGCENWFVMINVPSDQGQDWGTLIGEARANIIAKLSGILGRDIEPLILIEDVLTPQDIDRKTGSYAGSLYGSSSNDPLAAFLRHANFSRKVKGLYFTGGSVHPGGGIPLALLSAKIVGEMVR